MRVEYSYAKDIAGSLVHIANAIPGLKYYCPNCGNEMIPKLGEINAHHFAHKVECACNGESYLHRVAKEKFKEVYDNSTEFILEYPSRIKCSYYDDPNLCPLSNSECDIIEMPSKRLDLKKIFNDCQIEGSVNNDEFKADILLRDTTGKTNKILLIEFYHTHKCTWEKIESGLPIVEIKIADENDIISSNVIKFNRQNAYYGFKTNSFKGKTLLYGYFDDSYEASDLVVRKMECEEKETTNYNDFYMCSSAFAIAIEPYSFMEYSGNPLYSKNPPSLGETICAIASSKGFKKFENCFACAHSRKSNDNYMNLWCKMSKDDQSIPKNAKIGNTYECKYFIPNPQRLKFLLKKINLLRYEILRCELPLEYDD